MVPDFAEVGQLRPLVLATLDRARKLRQRQDRHLEFLGDRLQTLGELTDLLHAVSGLGRSPDA